MRRALAVSSICACLTLFTAAAWADVPPPMPCSSKSKAGDSCNDFIGDGVCVEISGTFQCRASCASAGSACCGTGISCCASAASGETGSGLCVKEGGGSYCAPQDEPCINKKAGDACALENGASGTCKDSNPCGLSTPMLLCESTGDVTTGGSSNNSSGSGSSGCASAPVSAAAPWAAMVVALGAAVVALRRRRES